MHSLHAHFSGCIGITADLAPLLHEKVLKHCTAAAAGPLALMPYDLRANLHGLRNLGGDPRNKAVLQCSSLPRLRRKHPGNAVWAAAMHLPGQFKLGTDANPGILCLMPPRSSPSAYVKTSRPPGLGRKSSCPGGFAAAGACVWPCSSLKTTLRGAWCTGDEFKDVRQAAAIRQHHTHARNTPQQSGTWLVFQLSSGCGRVQRETRTCRPQDHDAQMMLMPQLPAQAGSGKAA